MSRGAGNRGSPQINSPFHVRDQLPLGGFVHVPQFVVLKCQRNMMQRDQLDDSFCQGIKRGGRWIGTTRGAKGVGYLQHFVGRGMCNIFHQSAALSFYGCAGNSSNTLSSNTLFVATNPLRM